MLTSEQQEVVNAVLSSNSDNKIIAVDSVAGSGKTTTAKAVIDAYKPNKGFYTAFNKAIVEDSKRKFSTIDVKTIHALAYHYVKPKKHEIQPFNYMSIKEDIPYEDKAAIIKILDNFYRSDSVDIQEYTEQQTNDQDIIYAVIKYANLMLDRKIPITFNFMLKYLHMMLLDNDIQINYDIVILDECQDTTAVTLEIFKLIKAKKKVMLGDMFQNIYSFMDTVNGFKILKDTINLRLTQSFRCTPEIAARIEFFGKKYLTSNFVFKGTDLKDTDKENYTESYLTRGNAALIAYMNSFHMRNQHYGLTRDIKDIFAMPIAMFMANAGKPVKDNQYKYLEIEYNKYQKNFNSDCTSFYDYLSNVMSEDYQVQNTINLLTSFRNNKINIFNVMNTAKEMSDNDNIILSTAHAFKGLETDIVYLNEDLNTAMNNALIGKTEWEVYINSDAVPTEVREIAELPKEIQETFNTYYVAMSRAKYKLINATYGDT